MLVCTDIAPCHEADAADHNEQHDNDIDVCIAAVCCQRGEFFAYTEQIKACITKCRDRMEDRIPDAPSHAEIADEYRTEQCSTRQLNDCGGLEDEACQVENIADLRCGDGFLHDAPLFESDPASGQADDCKRDRNNAHTADLDQRQDDELPEERPVRCGVLHDQSGHTGT